MKVAFYKYHRGGIKGLFDWLIRIVTNGPYSHCELIFSDGQAYSSSIQDGGCRYKDIVFDPEHWDIIEVAADEQTMRRFCDEEKGSGYDFPGVFRFLVLEIKESPDKWFCSEVCASALQHGGRLLGVKPWQVHPSRLYQLLTT